MIGISIAAKKEWQTVLSKYNIDVERCKKYPYGEYFMTTIQGQEVIFYRCGVRKTNCSAATQFMICNFKLSKIIVVGTCAGIDDKYKTLDIVIPNRVVQYDCTVKEIEPLIKDSLTISFDLGEFEGKVNTGTLGTADKAVVMWKDYLELKENNITVADTEAASIAYICRANNVECMIIKGISDFPTNEEETSKEQSYEGQSRAFLTNIPIIVNNILDNYLPFAINHSIKYKDCIAESVTIRKK